MAQATTEPVLVAPCDLGKGVFAREYIGAGQTVLIFVGKVITASEVRQKGPHEGDALQVDVSTYLDLNPPGCFVNHSCAPNAGVANSCHLVAVRPIAAGEEIRIDYSTTMLERNWQMTCRFAAPTCRGTIDDFDRLPRTLQEHYLRLGIVQPFIVGALKRHQVRRF